ncbi:unnamed protein product [Rotaria magnacalcarata]|uniref:UMOD/GP2/OIT3-like D8C domain-containing protein n=1 Tax=Rotaria magnacalcarata TaxID=392030 RepID=A0A816NWR7_9BILA|nr:unnamed protein product [Rotaria magnacalcarata]CAF2119706.1 unnamed protein product [Rotaria magnacalcarata]CAF3948033.1 unnamed protein product [Rotaria magnacalcarata]CAF4008956.1 unnamed protein product [Rotaria magnacalcarata]CAF4024033.1 unnamed protein product [Rotaria magnacalcarata]
MTTKIQPYRQYPQNKVRTISPSNEKILSDNDTITQSDIIWTPTYSKSKILQWSTILWISLGTLIFLFLSIVVVIPIVVLTNKTNGTTNTTITSTICPTTAITTTVTSSSLPFQCSNYTTITDETRSPDYSGSSSCDNATFPNSPAWFRFTGSGGTLLASCPIDEYRCGTDYPGWYSGIYPSLAGAVTSGSVCYNSNGNLCYYTSSILITNCNGFYIYYLTQPSECNLRYCTI